MCPFSSCKRSVIVLGVPLILAGAWMAVAQGFDFWSFAAASPPQTAPVAPAPEPETPKKATAASGHAAPPQLLARTLERLHQQALGQFESDPLNGLSRMPLVYQLVVREWQVPWFSPGDLDGDEPIPFRKQMEGLHAGSVTDFLDPTKPLPARERNPLFVVSAAKDRVAGAANKVWEAKQVDLIGLLKRPEPVVYVSERLAEMKETGRAPMRDLDEFEAIALLRLQKGENLFARARDGVVRMVGAIRANSSCLSCHDDRKEGDLLGAFSYVVREGSYERVGLGGMPRVPVKSR